MKIKRLTFYAVMLAFGTLVATGQTPLVIHDPTIDAAKPAISSTQQAVFDRSVLPKAREKLAGEACEEEIDIAGVVDGAFTRKGSKQTAVFYQFCQTGNGLGSVGFAILENGKLTAHYVSAENAWTVAAKALPDINRNGVDEIALYYSGGMHQGSGGTGVAIMEISRTGFKEVGWLQVESFTDDSPVTGYKISVIPGRVPAFKREKYIQNSSGKWRKAGKPVAFKLSRLKYEFEAVN